MSLMLFAAPALARDDCTVPMTEWQPREAVMQLAAENGWELRRIRIDDGCYEAIGRDADGRSFEVKLDPATLTVVELEFENDHDDDENEDQDHND